MSVSFDDTDEFDPQDPTCPHTNAGGAGYIEFNSGTATKNASGYSWDRVDFSKVLRAQPAGVPAPTWTLDLQGWMEVQTEGYATAPLTAPQVWARSKGVVAVWGDFTSHKGTERFTDEFAFNPLVVAPQGGALAKTLGFATFRHTLPDGSEFESKGDITNQHEGSRHMPPEYTPDNPQTYNPNQANIWIHATGQKNSTQLTFSYYSLGELGIINERDGSRIAGYYHTTHPNSLWTGSVVVSIPRNPGLPIVLTWNLR